ncbi:hypothetical protein GCM10011374_32920 [Kocuria dechangensis]|uniref:Major facilitator superfamily (MFS) profile domain-containing protein n=1 Tax=Kocuria dechangensis TaxID=1176249 RepID=A0A917H3J3_9MICC|nr:MFS transporter [Kocuria dechangensis]GGG66279.1 hypothetical protein GCM10011374_32920 [Kocuria dechangensis]
MTSFLTVVVCFAATTAPTVLYSVWRAQMGFSATVQTVVFAVYVAGLVPGLVVAGALLHRLSPRWLMTAGTAVSVAAALVLAVAPVAAVLVLARVVQGVALGVVMAASSAALYRGAPPRPREFTALLITLTAAIGASAGPVGAGVLADVTGRGTTVPMLGWAVLLAGCLVLLGAHGSTPVPARDTETGRDTAEDGAGRPGLSPGADRHPVPRGLVMISLTAGLSWGVVGIYQSVGPGLIGQALGVDSLTVLGAIVAIVLTVGGIVQIATRRVPVPRSRRLGMGFLLLAIMTFAAMLLTGNLALALVAALCAGVGHGFTYLSATHEIGELIRRHPHRAGAWMSAYFAIAYLCLAVLTVALGVLGDIWDLTSSALALMGAIAVGCLAMLFSGNRPGSP